MRAATESRLNLAEELNGRLPPADLGRREHMVGKRERRDDRRDRQEPLVEVARQRHHESGVDGRPHQRGPGRDRLPRLRLAEVLPEVGEDRRGDGGRPEDIFHDRLPPGPFPAA